MQYETFDEILNAEIIEAALYNGNYYFLVNYKDQYHNTVWVVDKNTEKVSQISLIDYMIEIMDYAKPIDPKTLKRAG